MAKHRRPSPTASLEREHKKTKTDDFEGLVKYKINFFKDFELEWIDNVIVTAHASVGAKNPASVEDGDVEDISKVKPWSKQVTSSDTRVNQRVETAFQLHTL